MQASAARRITGTLQPGELLDGRYRIVRMVGKGGFGAVYEANDERFSLRRVVAVKEMGDAGLSPTERVAALQNFRHEADLLVELNHTNLPHVSDFFEEGDNAYLVMQFIHGDTLAKVKDDTGGPLDEQKVMGWALQLCDVLSYLHTHQPPIIFRDIKPENIMLTQDGQIKLIDFGIARIFKSAAQNDTNYLGSWGYAPIEQYGRGQSDARTDIYALGATLYALLTNTIPLDSPARFLSSQAFRKPSQVNPRVSERTERIIMKAMELSPQDRFQTAADMYAAIIASGIVPQKKGAPFILPAARPAQKAPPVLFPPQGAALPARLLASRHQAKNQWRWGGLICLLIFLVLLASFLPRLFHSSSTSDRLSPGCQQGSIGPDGIGVYMCDGETIGISDGKYALDTKMDRKEIALKIQACSDLRAGRLSEAQSLWKAYLQQNTNDAEALIYLENQRVLASGRPSISLVIGVLLGTNTFDAYSRDYLQAAYVAQNEFNSQQQKLSGGMELRLLIAKSGSNPDHSTDIARQVVRAAHFDKTIVGVMGWTTSATSVATIPILAQAHIPLVSAGTASDQLTAISPYFFRVGSPNRSTVKLLAKYIEVKLHPRHVLLFEDSGESYSQSLAETFALQYTADGYRGHLEAKVVPFKTGGPSASLAHSVREALQEDHTIDVVMFTSNNVNDMTTVLSAASQESAQVNVVMGIAGYEVTESDKTFTGYNHLIFSSAAFPDEDGVFSRNAPPFFQDYNADFNPNNTHQGCSYYYCRPNSFVMLGYDAMQALLKGSRLALQTALQKGKNGFTPDELQQALTHIDVRQPLPGITGEIAFGQDGDPINKINFVLRVDQHKFLHIKAYQGCFMLNIMPPCDSNKLHWF